MNPRRPAYNAPSHTPEAHRRWFDVWQAQAEELHERAPDRRPVLFLGNLSQELRRAEGRRTVGGRAQVWNAARARLLASTYLAVAGRVGALMPTADLKKAINTNTITREQYLRRFTRWVDKQRQHGHAPLIPGILCGTGRRRGASFPVALATARRPVLDGDAIGCACPARRDWRQEHQSCHLEEAAWWLLQDGWDVVLYGRKLILADTGPIYAESGLPYVGPVRAEERSWNPGGSQLFGKAVYG